MYDEIEPLTERRQDWRNAHIVQMLYNTMGRGERDKARPLKDFILHFDGEEGDVKKPVRTQSLTQQAQMLHVLAAMHANDGDGMKPQSDQSQIGPLPPQIQAQLDKALGRT